LTGARGNFHTEKDEEVLAGIYHHDFGVMASEPGGRGNLLSGIFDFGVGGGDPGSIKSISKTIS